MTKSKKMSKTLKKFDFRMKPKITTLLPKYLMLLDHCYSFGLLL